MTDRLWTCSAEELAALYAAREASPVEALGACLDRAAEIGDGLNAIVARNDEAAFRDARASEARWAAGTQRSPLDGVPLTVKDNIPVAGMPATWGSRVFADYRPQRDETPVRRLREAGAIVFAKTNAPEFTLQGYTSNDLFGTTRNPWDSTLTPGGSSGGAVACVAAGIGPLAIATDGGGSIRRPASHAGLVGLKPTAGRVPRRDGFPPILLDFEVIGPIARTVSDIVVATALMSRADSEVVAQASFAPFSLTFASPPERRRVLFVPTFADAPVDPEIAASVAAAASNLARLGHEVTESRSFDLADEINAKWPAVAQTGLAWLMREHADKRDRLGASIRAMADAGDAVPATDFFDAMHAAHVLRGRLAELFTSYDMILTPTAAALPWPAEITHPGTIAGIPVGPRGAAIFTGFVNAAGCPAISIPCTPSRSGLPIGLQLIAPWGRDEDLCAVGAQYEAAFPWPAVWDRGGS
jgi:aspartyl-tRNA(Asn)/glutamyl-tRNA(Gln) amidotransferase subunit A